MALEPGAAAEFERLRTALARAPGDPGNWCALAALYLSLEQPEQAREALRRALTLAPDDTRALALGGAACLALDDPAGAERAARAALVSDADHGPAWRVLGDALFALDRAADAADALRQACARAPDDARCAFNLGLALDEARRPADATDALAHAIALDPGLDAARSQLAHLERRLCDWTDLEAHATRLREAVRAGRPGVAPFAFLTESGDPAEQRMCAGIHAREVVSSVGAAPDRRPGQAPAASSSPRARGSRPRIAFVSSGFNNHPTGILSVDLIERLRESRLETHGFATTPADGGAVRARLERGFAHFHDAAGLSHRALADAIRAQDIDVLVDLRGYGGGSVAPALAMRPAPVQVNWLAYPGTSGAPWIDVLVADAHVVPAAAEPHYSERVLRMPHCFQPSDATRVVEAPPSRAACGLPNTGVVFASFNNSYKITPEVFAAWMRILAATPGSVLWLLDPGDGGIATANLRRAAAARDIDPSRVIAMPKLAHDAYLARYAHVDLFLDTWPYGAHTTASDALFAGCPVLTLEGASFASRVAGSLLTTLGMPELIAADAEDYVKRAVELGADGRAMRARIAERRAGSPLFDMARFARDFEALWLALLP